MTCLEDFEQTYVAMNQQMNDKFWQMFFSPRNAALVRQLAGVGPKTGLEHTYEVLLMSPVDDVLRRCLNANLSQRETSFMLKYVSKMQVQTFIRHTASASGLDWQSSPSGYTALMQSAKLCNDLGVYQLLRAGARRDPVNSKGETAFQLVQNLCEQHCGYDCLDCRHANVRALLVLQKHTSGSPCDIVSYMPKTPRPFPRTPLAPGCA